MTANDRPLRRWLREQRPELDTAALGPAALRSTALAVIALDSQVPRIRASAHRALADQLPPYAARVQPTPRVSFIRATPPIRFVGEAYRTADPRHYLHLYPRLDTSGRTIYLTNDAPPGHPDSHACLDWYRDCEPDQQPT